jgi:KDO2-lipid IV(A) lauroyltransferase
LKTRSAVRNWAEYIAVRALLRFPSSWPLRQFGRLRRIGLRNLELAGLPASTLDGTYRSLERLIRTFRDFPAMNRQNIHQWIRYQGFEHFQEAKRRGKGVLFATAHLGNWELSAYAHALMAEPMSVVVRPLDNPLLNDFVQRRRAASGNTILGKKEFLRGVLEALRLNRAVGILIDQDAGSAGVFVDFFGRKASVDAGFARLAHRTGAAVIPGFALWNADENRFVLHFEPIVEMTGDVAADSQRLHGILERMIRQHPDQWLWIHRRWKTRPPGEQPLYG